MRVPCRFMLDGIAGKNNFDARHFDFRTLDRVRISQTVRRQELVPPNRPCVSTGQAKVELSCFAPMDISTDNRFEALYAVFGMADSPYLFESMNRKRDVQEGSNADERDVEEQRVVFSRKEPFRLASQMATGDAIVIQDTPSALGLRNCDLVRNPPSMDAAVLYARSGTDIDALRKAFPERSIWRYSRNHPTQHGRLVRVTP